MQTQRNPNFVHREQNKIQNQTPAQFSFSVEEKLSIMEALDHLHVSRQYQEMGACAVCKKVSAKKCSGCGIFYCSSECQTYDWPKHRLHCSKQKDSLSERNSFASSRKMRGTSVKNFNEESFLFNDRSSPFTALANQLNKKAGSTYSGTKNVGNFKFGNRQQQDKDQMSKNNETGSNGYKDYKRSILNDWKKGSPKKLTNRISPSGETREMSNNKNNFKVKQQNSGRDLLKAVENIQTANSTFGRKSLQKVGKMEVIGTFRESPNRYWVMDVNNLKKYEEIQRILNEEFKNYESTYAKVGLVCGCTFADEWFRAKVISLTPETTVHFIDYGNSSNYDLKIFKKLPNDLESIPGLVFLVEFEEGTPSQYKTADLDSLKLTIEETTVTTDGVAKVKILEGAFGPTLKLQPVKKPSDKELVKSKTHKSVMNCLTAKSNGMLFFIPGEGTIRFASIVPDNQREANECLEKVLDIDNPNSTPFEAVEGDYVLVTVNEGNNQRGRVISKIGSSYYVQLIDCGNVVSTEKVYPLPEDLKDWIELGVKVTIEEFILPEQVNQLETCFFVINGEQTSEKWPCIIKNPEQQIIAKGLLEKPIEAVKWHPEYINLKSGSTVEISSLSSPNSFYVQSVDAETEQKFLDMNMEMIHFARAKSYSVPPSVGELCCARFKGDSCFYRAIVNSVVKEKIKVLFVDFGNEQLTDLKDVKPLSDSLKNIPFFAVKVRLRNVSNKSWNNMIKEYITKLTSENIELTLLSSLPSKLNAAVKEKLPELVNRKGVILQQDNVRPHEVSLATRQNLWMDIGSIANGVILREKVSGIVVNEFMEKAKDKSSDSGSVKSNLLKNEIFLDDDLQYTTVISGSTCDLALLFVDENEFKISYTFWATVAEVDNFKYVNGELSSLIRSYCAAVTAPYEPSFRELCLAEFEGFWYRAACIGSEQDIFKVFFVDFGNICELKSSCIRKITKDFIKAPALALNCTVKGFERLKENPELTKKIWEILQERMNTLISGVTITKAKDELFLVEIAEVEAVLSG